MSAFGLDEFSFSCRPGRGCGVEVDLTLEGQAIREVFVRSFVGAREERIERRGETRNRLTDLKTREGAVGVAGRVAVPEVDMPPGELPHPVEAMRIGAPVLSCQRDVTSIDRDA